MLLAPGCAFSAPALLPPQQQQRCGRRRAFLTCLSKSAPPEDGWQQRQQWRQVTLNQADMEQLKFSRMLGLSRDMSIAKVVAKKLNPSATNLELEKMIKKTGAKAFIDLLTDKVDEEEAFLRRPVTRKQEHNTGVVPLAPKPGLKASPPSRSLNARQQGGGDRALSADNVADQRLWDFVEEDASKEPKKVPRKQEPQQKLRAPQLQARPFRGGGVMSFPTATTRVTRKDSTLPRLSMKPDILPRNNEEKHHEDEVLNKPQSPQATAPVVEEALEEEPAPEAPTSEPVGALEEEPATEAPTSEPAAQVVSDPEILRRPLREMPVEVVAKPQYFPGPPTEEEADKSWARALVALDSKEIQEVLYLGSNAGGMIARFECLNGFVPGKELKESRGVKSFRSWASEKGHDVNHMSILSASDISDAAFATPGLRSEGLGNDTTSRVMHPACEMELHKLYSEERAALLSSFVGQKASVVVTYVDRSRRKLILSEKKAAAEDSEIVRRRKDFIAKLKVGDVVLGKVQNMSTFGVFVELAEEVTGLIHSSELSWTMVPDPTSVVGVGEEIQAKVFKLDMERQRIYLSLKRMSPDPLLETVESMLEKGAGIASSESASEVISVPELDALMAKLESWEGIKSVSKGRYLQGVAVVPNFQVYLSSEEQPGGHKLLARFGNKVHEVLVRTSVDKEAMKKIIVEATSAKRN